MSDLISRQALCEYALNQKNKSVTPNDIMRFPPAQPKKRTEERTKTHACDLISRQAAIDHLKKRLYETALNNNTEHPYYEEIADNRVDIWLNELPSAQPEVLACGEGELSTQPQRKKGKWITNSTIINCSVCKHCSWTKSSFKDLVMSFNYCPNCGADMRGDGEADAETEI